MEGAGGSLTLISPQTPQNTRRTVNRFKLSVDLLSDAGNQVAREYGLVWELPEDLREVYLRFGTDLEEYNGDGSWTLPMPARYVIDGEGIVRWASVSPDYTMRPDPIATIEALRALGSS